MRVTAAGRSLHHATASETMHSGTRQHALRAHRYAVQGIFAAVMVVTMAGTDDRLAYYIKVTVSRFASKNSDWVI